MVDMNRPNRSAMPEYRPRKNPTVRSAAERNHQRGSGLAEPPSYPVYDFRPEPGQPTRASQDSGALISERVGRVSGDSHAMSTVDQPALRSTWRMKSLPSSYWRSFISSPVSLSRAATRRLFRR